MGALRQDRLADETVGPNITWLDLIPKSSVPNEESSREPAMNWRHDFCVIIEDWECDNSYVESRC
jgi:hypothetical protein